ncbi:MAG TPA: ABC transporter ATP-binding protein [Egibacteraceae bacterium]|nr:ABC transporter ATP-binding protein [Egibacteraceae bacterium]
MTAEPVTPVENDVGWRDILTVVRGHGRWVAAGVVLTVAASALSLVQPLVVKRLIDAAGTGPILWGLVGLLVVLFAGQALLQAATRYLLARTSEGIVVGLRLNLIGHLLRLHMPAYDRYRIGDLISRAGTDTAALRRVIAEGFTDVVAGGIGVLGAVAFMIWLDWALFLIVATLIVVGGTIVLSVLRGIRSSSLRTQQATGEMTADLERALSAVRTIRASQAEQRETERIGGRARAAYAQGVRLAKLDAVVGPASELAVSGSFLAVLLVGGMRVTTGATSVADLVAFLLYMTYLAVPIGALFMAVSAIQQGTGALHRINEILDLPPEPGSATSAVLAARSRPVRVAGLPPGARPNPGAAPVLEFRDVWFGYEPGRAVLRGVSFAVPERSHIALVGPSGAGKSTIFALAERFYDPDRGEILFAGTDVRDIDRAEHRARIGFVEQHCPILHGTLRDNLLYTVPDADEGKVERVVALANLTEVLDRLPRGLDTPVGEHGMMLSGGERQRLAIARSLLSRPGLLLLDEPTSQLDPVNEAALAATLDQVADECALLVIAHRYSTVRAADRVIVLDRGEVVAAGSHDELLDTSAYYRSLAAGWLDGSAPLPSAPSRTA